MTEETTLSGLWSMLGAIITSDGLQFTAAAAFLLAFTFYVLNGLLWLFKTGKLLPILAGAAAKLGQLLFANKVMQQMLNERRLPPLIVPTSMKGFIDFGSILSFRSDRYTTLFKKAKSYYSGAYALSFIACDIVRPEFKRHKNARKHGLATYTEKEEKYLKLVSEFDEELTKVEQQYLDRINKGELMIKRIKFKASNNRLKLVCIHRLPTAIAAWKVRNTCKKLYKRLRKKQRAHHKGFKGAKKLLYKQAFKEKLTLMAMQLCQIDEQQLRHKIHMLHTDAELHSSMIHSGYLFEYIRHPKDTEAKEEVAAISKKFKFAEDFPYKKPPHEVTAYMLKVIGKNHGLTDDPEAEDVLEVFFRHQAKVHSLFDAEYLANLPAPGSTGLAQQKYAHILNELKALLSLFQKQNKPKKRRKKSPT